MKIYINVIAAFLLLIIFTSCVKEVMINPDPSFTMTFQHDGKTDASAGDPFYVIPSGSGEFLTLFDGTPDHVYGEVGSKGKDFNKADSMLVKYNDAGKYKLTVVASSSGNLGKDYSSVVNTVEVNVIDARNSFFIFYINGVAGTITGDSILFSVPDVIKDFNFKPVFIPTSSLSTVTVNGEAQVSNVTQNDFAQPVVYVVKSATGDEKQYTVKVSTFVSSTEKQITKFAIGFGGYGEIGIIDEINKTINLSANYNTKISNVKLVIKNSYASKVLINGTKTYSVRNFYDLATDVKSIKVIAQDLSEVVYTIKTVLGNPVLSFTFAGLLTDSAGVINTTAKTITIDVLRGTDVTKLTAKWTGSKGKVTIEPAVQTNGVTVNDFTSPLTYTFYKGGVAGDKYKVTVNKR